MKYRFPLMLALLLAASAVLYGADDSHAAHFGTRCQQDFQNSWQTNLSYVWRRCSWFNNELDDTDTKDFYFNLHGARTAFSSCDDCGAGPDDVHLFYVSTHGGANATDARLVMWDQNVRARSNTDDWRLGDEDRHAAFFAQYACSTLKLDGIIDRWVNTFRGGLIMATGSHDKLYDSLTTDETGEDFADDLQDGKRVKWAWFDGNGDWWEDQDVAILASGSSNTDAHDAQADCHYRRDRVKWQTFGDYARWRDNDVEWMCWSWISNN